MPNSPATIRPNVPGSDAGAAVVIAAPFAASVTVVPSLARTLRLLSAASLRIVPLVGWSTDAAACDTWAAAGLVLPSSCLTSLLLKPWLPEASGSA
jgi:hypothetical protein